MFSLLPPDEHIVSRPRNHRMKPDDKEDETNGIRAVFETMTVVLAAVFTFIASLHETYRCLYLEGCRDK